MMKAFNGLLCVCAIILLCRCAQVVSLSGGAPDRTPPKVLHSIPEQNSVAFTEQFITLEFDEYIQVLDAANELFISPRLKELPDLTVKGKKLIVNFKGQPLLRNTTYHLSFGKAIADMNERNILEGYEFTFSTGAHIDSLKLSGEILQAEDNQAAASMLVGLYSSATATDSLPYKTEPIYICRGSKTGQFTFNHLPAGNYQVFAIDDKNKNYLYDGEQERIAFYGENLQLTADSSIALKAFKEPSFRTFVAKTISPNYGRAFIILNKPFKVAIRPLDKSLASKIQIVASLGETDSVEVYYKDLQDTLALIAQMPENSGADTLYVKLPRIKKRVLQVPELVVTSLTPSKTDRVNLRFTTWMDTLVKPKLKLKWMNKNDSNSTFKTVDGHWLNTRNYQIHQALQPGTSYQIVADSAAFSDLNHNSNDSLAFSLKTKSQADFGKLVLKIRFKIKQHYQIELLNEQGKVVEKRSVFFSLSSSNVASLEFSDLQPGIYKVKIIYDTNENGKWDGGNLLKRVQPEKISVLSKQIKVISDWELEENLEEK